MKQSNADFLESNRDCYNEVVNAQTATKANKIKGELYRIIKEEFLPGYVYRDDCGSCLFDMVNIIYRKYDDWKASQPAATKLIIETPDEPIEVKASFPSHKEDDVQETIDYHTEMAKATLKLEPPLPPIKQNKKHHRR